MLRFQQATLNCTLTMSSPSQDGLQDGHRSSKSPTLSPHVASRLHAESDLSDVPQTRVAAASPSPSPDLEDSTMYMNGGHDFAESSSSADENNASDDADFDVDDDVANPPSDGAGNARSSSHDSQQAPKRKATVAAGEDQYIKANPELYGLRRSV